MQLRSTSSKPFLSSRCCVDSSHSKGYLQKTVRHLCVRPRRAPRGGVRFFSVMADSSPDRLLEERQMTSVGDLSQCCGHWVTKDCLVWRKAQTDNKGGHFQFVLHVSYPAQLQPTSEGVLHSEKQIKLRVLNRKEQYSKLEKFPHLLGCTLLQIEDPDLLDYPRVLKSQLLIACEMDGKVFDVTGVQCPGVLDACFTFDGELGFVPQGDDVYWLRLWAPTAQTVEVLCWDSAQGGLPKIQSLNAVAGGIWELQIGNDKLWKFYKFRVTVYCPWSQKIETMEVTDPYSRSLAANGARSQFIDITDTSLKPDDWDNHKIPDLMTFSDISVYELHVRDFSIRDKSVPTEMRGKYVAFNPSLLVEKTGHLSKGLEHLKILKEAGMTHIHLLPVYDFASVPERPEEQLSLDFDQLYQFGPDSEEQQKAAMAVADRDGFNWGYDPVHWGVPDGSYSTNPDGIQRISEFRQMVSGLHELGYRVVLDVVYNHTFEGQGLHFSVFDKIVPGYYHRQEDNGMICGSACGANCAPEHFMVEKLIIDDILHWAIDYRIDGFRFDIMSHLMLTTMEKIRAALDELTIENHGVDGKKIYLYGEGWDFAETANNQRGRNAQQLNLAGTGIGTFNDRFRDSALGGSPFGPPRFQGFITGLGLQPNLELDQGSIKSQLRKLLESADLLKATISGNLMDCEIFSSQGEWTQGKKIKFYGHRGAYCMNPSENVIFCGCHDNETLFDHAILKAAPDVNINQRVRMCEMAMAMVLLSQGIAFIHAGDDLLRSKSLDRDSYNSGDWFNFVDWTRQSNNFGVGLPPHQKNGDLWPFYKPLLANTELKPGPELIHRCFEHVLTFLRIRYSSPLFRIHDPNFIKKQIVFYNTGPKQIPGIIIMELNSAYSSGDEGIFDEQFKRIVVIFNARPDYTSIKFPTSQLELHPILCSSSDAIYSEVEIGRDVMNIPQRLSVVLTEPRFQT